MVREFDDDPGENAQESEDKKHKDSGDFSALMGESTETEPMGWAIGSSATESLDTEPVATDLGALAGDTEPVGPVHSEADALPTERMAFRGDARETEKMHLSKQDEPGPGLSESLPTEQVSDFEDHPLDSVGTTEHVPEDELQLLAGSPSVEEIPMVSEAHGGGSDPFEPGAPTQQLGGSFGDFGDETELVPGSSAQSDSTQEGDDYRGDFSDVASAGLRTVNPHSAGSDEEDDFYGAGEDDDFVAEYSREDNVGVIDEIAALASSLDEDILSAEDAPDAGLQYETDLSDDYGGEVSYEHFEAPRKSRKGLVMTMLTLAALAALGVVYYPTLIELVEKFRPSEPSTAVANASNTGTGPVDPVKPPPPPVGGPDGSDPGTEALVDPGVESTADSTTIAIRQSVAISMKNGMRWKD